MVRGKTAFKEDFMKLRMVKILLAGWIACGCSEAILIAQETGNTDNPQGKPAAKEAEKEPEFKEARFKQDYETGIKLFEEKKYKDASVKFLSALKGTSKQQDRK